MTPELLHEKDAHRYTLHHGDELIAVADYALRGNSISFTHTYTSPRRRGNGHAGEVVGFAMDDVEQNTDLRVIPMCWYVADWFEAHPERAHLLTRGT